MSFFEVVFIYLVNMPIWNNVRIADLYGESPFLPLPMI